MPRNAKSSEDDGWVLAVWYDEQLNRSEMVVLDAQNFAGAPVARDQIAASRAVGLSRQLGARAMKKATRPARAPTRERAREGPNDGLGYLRFPTRKASLDLALLGLIAEVPGVSGYDIMKIFDLSMAHYWHAHPTQIYPTLDRMEEFGLIKRRNVVQRNRPTSACTRSRRRASGC